MGRAVEREGSRGEGKKAVEYVSSDGEGASLALFIS